MVSEMSKFKEGDRVTHEYLGDATVLKKLEFGSLYLIKTDTTPAIEYNMGQRETAEFAANLKLINQS